MAIDIKTLRIGSHILVNGKRERVRGMDEDNGLIVRFPAEYVNANEVEPIAITSELLSEFGFECAHNPFSDEWEKRWGGTDGFFDNNYIGFSQIRDDMWRVHLYTKGAFCNGQTVVRYLHEAEAFLVLHGVELINENKNN